jgi:hypothetical protein
MLWSLIKFTAAPRNRRFFAQFCSLSQAAGKRQLALLQFGHRVTTTFQPE